MHRDSGQATWIQPRSEFTVTVDGQALIAVVGQVSPRRNPELLKGQKGGRIGPKMKLKDRVDAIIAPEYDDIRAGGEHAEAIKNAAKKELPISDEARRLNRARAR